MIDDSVCCATGGLVSPQEGDRVVSEGGAGDAQTIAELYARARDLYRARQWTAVLEHLRLMRSLGAEFDDTEGLGRAATAALASERYFLEFGTRIPRGQTRSEFAPRRSRWFLMLRSVGVWWGLITAAGLILLIGTTQWLVSP